MNCFYLDLSTYNLNSRMWLRVFKFRVTIYGLKESKYGSLLIILIYFENIELNPTISI